MVLPPNRVGAIRGDDGTTLKDIKLLLEQISAKLDNLPAAAPDYTAAFAAINDVLGTRADCSSGDSIVGLLCMLNGDIGGKVGQPSTDPPLTVCPGYEAGITFGPSSFSRAFYNGNPTSNYYATFAGAPAAFGLETEPWPWAEGGEATSLDFFYWAAAPETVTQMCITVETEAPTAQIELLSFDPSTYDYTPEETLNSLNYTGQTSNEVTLMANRLYIVKVVSPDEHPHAWQAWITAIPE